MTNKIIKMDMGHSKYSIKEEPVDFKEEKSTTVENTWKPVSEDNPQGPEDLLPWNTEGTVEIGEEFISLIKADPEGTVSNLNDLHQIDPLSLEEEKTKEETSSVIDNNRPVPQTIKRRPEFGIGKLSHLKEKCPHCEKLVVSSRLSDHVGQVHRPFVCDIFDKGFSKETILKKHRNTVHVDKANDKRFKCKCDYCEERFRCKSRLARHCRNVHKIFP